MRRLVLRQLGVLGLVCYLGCMTAVASASAYNDYKMLWEDFYVDSWTWWDVNTDGLYLGEDLLTTYHAIYLRFHTSNMEDKVITGAKLQFDFDLYGKTGTVQKTGDVELVVDQVDASYENWIWTTVYNLPAVEEHLTNYTFHHDSWAVHWYNCEIELKDYYEGQDWWAFRITAPLLVDGFLESAAIEDEENTLGMTPRLIMQYSVNPWLIFAIVVASCLTVAVLGTYVKKRFF